MEIIVYDEYLADKNIFMNSTTFIFIVFLRWVTALHRYYVIAQCQHVLVEEWTINEVLWMMSVTIVE